MTTVKQWLDTFFDVYYRRFPVNASFIGRQEFDSALPDFSAAGRQATIGEINALLESGRALATEDLTAMERLDFQAAQGFLETQLWELSSGHVYERNPSYYCGEAIFGVMGLFLSGERSLAARTAAATARMAAIPDFLRQAQAELRSAPRAWIDRALEECQGGLAFFQEGVQALAAEQGISAPAFLAAARQAAQGFSEFSAYLRNVLLPQATDEYAAGPEALDLLIRRAHFLDESAVEIAAYAEKEWAGADAYLREHAQDFGASSPEEALARLAGCHPAAQDYLASFRQTWDAARRVAAAEALVTWPDFPIEYQERPVWSRQAAPHLYFLFYRAPAAFNRPAVHPYLVSPLPQDNQEAFLRANNDSVIKLNHVVHHGSIGHHVQNWNAFHSASRVGQVAGVDTASRIAMLTAGTLVEGWACYATGLMAEHGFLTPLEAYSEYQGRRRMCARAVVDVRLHRGDFTFDQAVSYYRQKAGMSAAAARAEVTKNSMFPGGALMYITGQDAIFRLRAELRARAGQAFDLRAFHDQFLSYGALPTALICKEMKGNQAHAL